MPMANNQLCWSHFKPDFTGKPKGDAETHLLRTMDWMTTHDFPEGSKDKKILFNSFGRSQVMVCDPKCSTATIKLGRFTRQVQATDTPNLAILESNISMHGDLFQFDEATDTDRWVHTKG